MSDSQSRGPRGVKRSPGSRLPALIGLVLFGGALMLALVVISVRSGPLDAESTELKGRTQVAKTFRGVEQNGPFLGSPDARVTVSLFNDLQCESCATYALRIMPRLVDRLVRPGTARVALRHFPMGVRERGVADLAAASAALQDREWQYVHLFYANQTNARGKGVTEELLMAVAKADSRLDFDRWDKDRESAEVDRRLTSDVELSKDLKLPAKPAVTVSGPRGSRKLIDAPSVRAIQRAVSAVR